jgi:hypothetical protein
MTGELLKDETVVTPYDRSQRSGLSESFGKHS